MKNRCTYGLSDWMKIREKHLKATRTKAKKTKIQVYLAQFQAKKRYDVRVANGEAPGV